MALTTSELRRIRYELGYNVLNAGAEPYIGVHAVFEQVIAEYMQSGASTTSTTVVSASAATTPVAITLASATGFAEGNAVVIDVDGRQERATVQALSGSVITVQIMKAHGATAYPVTVEGGESIVRDILHKLRDIGEQMFEASESAGLKSVGRGAIEWYGDGSTTVLGSTSDVQNHWRNELASALGVVNLRGLRGNGGGQSAIY